LILFNRDPI